jgi:hypothetical protein
MKGLGYFVPGFGEDNRGEGMGMGDPKCSYAGLGNGLIQTSFQNQ